MTNHLDWIESELRPMLEKCDNDAVVSWVRQQILASFKNGRDAHPRSPAKPDQKKAGVK